MLCLYVCFLTYEEFLIVKPTAWFEIYYRMLILFIHTQSLSKNVNINTRIFFLVHYV